MAAETPDIKKEIPKYLGIFAVLAALTFVSVGLSYFHFGWPVKILVALLIACLQGALVLCYSMHFISEKKTISLLLCLAAILLFFMMLVFYASYFSLPEGAKFVS